MMVNTRGKKVAIAMSGGVDSSVAAVLLQEAGYDVFGLAMELQSPEKTTGLDSVGEVVEKLKIPFHLVKFHDLFVEKVITYFIEEYLRGRTPNPCIACNQYLKFGALWEKAKSFGADYLATGHYARLIYHPEKETYLLYRGKDQQKDQSYVLYNLTQRQLTHTLFPLGELTKSQIKKWAVQLGLKVAEKPESQEICFIPNKDYKEYLRKKVGKDLIKPGKFINIKGEVLGEHGGLPFYTVGQRRGLDLALGYPLFVLALNPGNNTIIVGREKELFQKELTAQKNNFIAITALKEPLAIEAQIRYGAKAATAILTPDKDQKVKVTFAEPQRAITPGQAIVYYQQDLVIGGGIIEQVIQSATSMF